MNIHDKINLKDNLFLNLEPQQAMQLIKRNLIALAPYYKDRLLRQYKHVAESERFKSTFGKYRWELENKI
jgi:hypothetical protein